jgi:APA family basic amino acid/polyamine antiporter
MHNQSAEQLVRGLSLTDAASLVIGTVIGTGIFLKTAVMTQQVGAPGLVLAAWFAAGVLSLAGALTYAELGAMLPQAGGEYVFLRTAYGDAPAFLYGWMSLIAGASGSIASLAAGFAVFFTAWLQLGGAWFERSFFLLGSEWHWRFGWAQVVAVTVIVLFACINCAGVMFGGRLQTALTAAKALAIAVIVGGIFAFAPGVEWAALPAAQRTQGLSGAQAFGAAMLAALWAYDGWNNMPMVAGEVREPGRNVPRALIGGMLIVLAAYGLVNLAYFYALPVTEIAAADAAQPVAMKAAATFLGPAGTSFVTAAILLSILGALNGQILTAARVPYAMARDGLFFRSLATLGARSHVPVRALLFEAGWACVLALFGTFEQLTNYTVFALWLFYCLNAAAVFALRRKRPDAERPYRTFGYPFTPALFILVAICLLVNTLLANPLEAGAGVLLIALGLPLHFYFRARQRT